MKYKSINKLVLFGGSRILAEVIKLLDKYKFEVVVFSAARHLDDAVDNGILLKDLLKSHGIKYYATNDINKCKELKNEITPNSLGVAFGAAWTFEKPIVKLFNDNHFLDFMGINLPQYRGGAHYTWQILHNNKQGCCNLQIIHGGEDTFHMGEIIKRKEYKISENTKTPTDYYNVILPVEIKFFEEFIKELSSKDFQLKTLKENNSLHFPFLFTKKNALIDWSWDSSEIIRFINAFDDPYPGASTFIGDKRVFLRNVEFISKENFHPFTSGLVVRVLDDIVFIATKDGIISADIFNDQNKKIILDNGDRLFTPIAEIEKSRKFKVEYSAKGLK